ncbi:MAG: VWA domain-containing protein [Vicinamibacterales bacterium]
MRLRSCWTGLIAIGVIASAPASGQQPAPPPPQDPQQPIPIFRAGTAVVRVDVTVTGRGDEPVVDLQAADFDVEEDDVPQTVSTAQFLRVDGERTSDLNEPLDIRSFEHARLEAARDDVRLVAIFLDDYHIDKRPEITLPLREALIKFVNLFGPNDLLVLMEPLNTLDSLKYTRSKTDIINRIKAFEGRRGELYPVKSAVEEMQLTQRNWAELRAGVTLDALNALATQLGGLREGRKSIVFVSQGPPIQLGSPNDQRLNDAVKNANRGNVTIHVVDPRPLGVVGFGGDDVLRRIANETGGRAIVNTNDPTAQLKGVIADASAYYLVGYTPTRTTNDGKFHRITVKVKRRGTKVTARRGYWAASEKEMTAASEAKATPDNAALTTALSSLSDTVTGSAVTVWTGLSRGDEGRTLLTVTWEPNQLPPDRDKAARLEIQPLTDDNKPSEDARVIAGAPGEIPIMAVFQFPPGRQKLRMTSMTKAGDTIDRWVQTMTIPALAAEAIGLSTPRFLRARSVPELRAIEANPAPAPAASRRFRPSERVLVEIECYADGEAPEMTFELLNGKGDVLRKLDAPPLTNGRLRMTLPVGSLAPSVYVLRVVAAKGDQSAQQLTAFRVAP